MNGATAVLGLNLLGDGVRGVLDPQVNGDASAMPTWFT
jgi:hypothetical protein